MWAKTTIAYIPVTLVTPGLKRNPESNPIPNEPKLVKF